MIRRINVFVLFSPTLPVQKDSKLDVALLRASHQALLRKQGGIADAFLFVICGNMSAEQAIDGIKRYGFPDSQVILISSHDEDGNEIEHDELLEDVGNEISLWVKADHPSAISDLSAGDNDNLTLWWSGIEATEEQGCWPFEVEEFSALLPDSHKKRAATWLAILWEAMKLEKPSDWLAENRLSVTAAALCKWLHGFDAAAGNSSYNFDGLSAVDTLNINGFYLGYIFAKTYHHEYLEGFCDGDSRFLMGEALNRILDDKRTGLRDSLSKFFGSDAALFWALHSSIWPDFREPADDACNKLLNSEHFDDIAEQSEKWAFVTDGWSDSADS